MTKSIKLLVLFIATLLSALIAGIFELDIEEIPENAVEYKAYFNNCTAPVISKFTESYYGNIKMLDSIKEYADIIVSCDTSYKVDETSFKSEVVGYSPIVAAFPDKMISLSSNKNFSTLSNQDKVYFMTDMRPIIEAVLNSENGTINTAELGYDTKLDVKLAIPDNGCFYRRDVVDSIIYILADNKDITQENVNIIRDKLDTLLSKVENIKNPAEYLADTKDKIMLVPEYMYGELPRYTIYPVYWSNCYAIPLTMYINNNVSNENTELMTSEIKTMDSLYLDTHFRNQTRPSKDSRSYYTADTISVIYGQDNLAELLGDNYWR